MALILGLRFAGLPSSITGWEVVLAKGTTLAQMAQAILVEFPSRTKPLYVLQLSTALILAVAANTVSPPSNAGLNMAKNKYMPHMKKKDQSGLFQWILTLAIVTV